MFIKYLMQLSSTVQKIEYNFVPVWIAQVVPIRTPQYIFTKTLQYPQELHIIYLFECFITDLID